MQRPRLVGRRSAVASGGADENSGRVGPAALRGVPAGSIDQTLRIAIGGARVAAFRDPVGDAYPVVVRAPRAERMSLKDVEQLYIWTGTGAAAPVSEFAHPTLSAGPSRISRYNRERTVTVTAFTQPGKLLFVDIGNLDAAADLGG